VWPEQKMAPCGSLQYHTVILTHWEFPTTKSL